MRILVFYGKNNADDNYLITKKIISKFKRANVKEYFLPDDLARPCLDCRSCYSGSEKNCYAYRSMAKIYENMTDADLIIFSSPVVADNIPGYFKSFFDHFAFLWMIRRPNRIMFKKKALIITTSYEFGAKNAALEIKKNLNWWGISNVAMLPIELNDKKYKSNNFIDKAYNKVIKLKNNVSFKTKIRFTKCLRKIKKLDKEDYNYLYWKDEGWLNKKRPWHKI